MTATVRFYGRCAFTVAVGKTLLVFSYRVDADDAVQLRPRDMLGFNNILVFAPNRSFMHFDPIVLDWPQHLPLSYVFSDELKPFVTERNNIHLVKAGDSFTVADATVFACPSTGDGVSFLVQAEGISVFHAGELNLWHWREESTLSAISRAEEAFYAAVAAIPGQGIDIAFFPVDPNLGGFYYAGANHFIMARRPRLFVPTHFGDRVEIADDYAKRMRTRHTQMASLAVAGETVLVDLSVQPPAVRAVELAPPLPDRVADKPDETEIDFGLYQSDDPFAETDLPVDLPTDKPGGTDAKPS